MITKTLAQLREEIDSIDEPKIKIDLLEQAIQIAEEIKLEHKAYELRSELIEVANFGGYALKGIVAFSLILKYVDEHPKKVDIDDFIWLYRYVIESSSEFYQVDQEQIKEMTEDYRKRLLSEGYNLSGYYDLRYHLAYKMSHMEDIKTFYALKCKTPEEDFCEICNVGMHIDFTGLTEGYDAAELAAKDVLSGELKCDSVPEVPYCNLLYRALLEGRYDKAEMVRKKVYPLIQNDENFVGDMGWHIILFLIQGNVAEALTVFKKYFSISLNPTNSGRNLFEFSLGAYCLFLYMAKDNQSVILPFQIADQYKKMEAIESADLSTYFKNQTYTIAEKFDQRNGNEKYFKDILAAEKALF